MNAATAFRSALAAHPHLAKLRWGAGEDPMSKAVWYTAADHAAGLVAVVHVPASEGWLGAPHCWAWEIFDRAGSHPGPAVASEGCADVDQAVAGLAAAFARLAGSREMELASA